MLAKRFFPPAVWRSRKWPLGPAALFLTAFLALVFCGSAAIAQGKKADGKKKVPPSEDIELETADKVTLAATYYPGTEGKDTVPIILLHMFKGNRNDYSRLAPHLQTQGHAVLVADLRGHGESTRKEVLNARGEVETVPLDAATMPRTEFQRMVQFDVETLKDFFRDENNKGRVNIEKLCIVGAEMGASVALNWARLDWSRRPVGRIKLGQDVKALVLISPEWSTPGLPLTPALTRSNVRIVLMDPELQKVFKNPHDLDLRKELSVLIVAGKDDPKAFGNAGRLHRVFKRYHPDPPPKERAEKQDLFYIKLETSLKGTKMLGVEGLNLEKYIAKFIHLRLVNRSFPWRKRKKDPYAEP